MLQIAPRLPPSLSLPIFSSISFSPTLSLCLYFSLSLPLPSLPDGHLPCEGKGTRHEIPETRRIFSACWRSRHRQTHINTHTPMHVILPPDTSIYSLIQSEAYDQGHLSRPRGVNAMTNEQRRSRCQVYGYIRPVNRCRDRRMDIQLTQ